MSEKEEKRRYSKKERKERKGMRGDLKRERKIRESCRLGKTS